MNSNYSRAQKMGLATTVLTVAGLFFLPLGLALLPTLLFLGCCAVAPFFPQFSFFLPTISKGTTGSRGVALTFDDGPSPETTPHILQLLTRYDYQATFFVIGEKAKQYPGLIRDILAAGHTIGNHSLTHDNLLMLRSRKTLHQDVRGCQEILEDYGICPLTYRPPVGITNPHLKAVLAAEGLQAVTYSCRAFDGGNRKIKNMAQQLIRKVRPGDILLLHDLPPYGELTVAALLRELQQLFGALHTSGLKVVPLEELIDMPVMRVVDKKPSVWGR